MQIFHKFYFKLTIWPFQSCTRLKSTHLTQNYRYHHYQADLFRMKGLYIFSWKQTILKQTISDLFKMKISHLLKTTIFDGAHLFWIGQIFFELKVSTTSELWKGQEKKMLCCPQRLTLFKKKKKKNRVGKAPNFAQIGCFLRKMMEYAPKFGPFGCFLKRLFKKK